MNTPMINGAFLAMLQQHRRGEAMQDLSDNLRTLTDAVVATGRPGSLVVKFTLSPAAKGGALMLEDDIQLNEPKPGKPGSIFFADDDGNLLREDPKQLKMELRTVEGGAQPVAVPVAQAQ